MNPTIAFFGGVGVAGLGGEIIMLSLAYNLQAPLWAVAMAIGGFAFALWFAS